MWDDTVPARVWLLLERAVRAQTLRFGRISEPTPRRTAATHPENFTVPLLLLLLIGLPLIEVYFLIKVGSVIGAFPTIAVAILTAILGTWLVRHQGFGVLMRVRDSMARDQIPALELLDGALILAAGLFLLLPGFLTDCVGFLLLVPPLRRRLIRRYIHIVPVPTAGPDREPRVIEGRWRRED
jgi:UPF0716 protein FxsA